MDAQGLPMGNHAATARLADAFQVFCPVPESLITPGGYRDSAFALIDAVFSMQARYEGARRVVASYARFVERGTPGLPIDASTPDEHGVADLREVLRGHEPQEAAERIFQHRSKSAAADRLKAELVLEAATALSSNSVQVRKRQDIAALPTEPSYARQKRAWTSIRGLGPVTFEYFRMLCGAETSKPDVMVLGWLEEALGAKVGWEEGIELVAALTQELGRRWTCPVLQRSIDHTIWRHYSGRGLDPDDPVGWKADIRTQP